VANDHIGFQLKFGEVHALLGENGAGKSTLMSILFGLYTPDEGEIRINDEKVTINNPNDAHRYKVGMVHQHFKLIDVYTVLENIVLGEETTRYGFLDLEDSRVKVMELASKYQLHVDLDAKIEDISVGMQQRVEILKMLYREADILIFDEPTAVLTPQEVDELIEIIHNFKREGKAIIIISHKLEEIMRVADRCTVLRRGKYIGTVEVKNTTVDELAEMMVGRQVSFTIDKTDASPKEDVLVVEDLNYYKKEKHVLKDINFKVRAGEIVGIAGIEGNGQTELISILSGLTKNRSGKITINDADASTVSIRRRYELGTAHIPEDRHRYGLILDFNLAENLIMSSYYKPEFQRHGILNYVRIHRFAEDLIQKFDIRTAYGSRTIVRSMSGGNQQKAIIAREISRKAKLLYAVQPTRGLDVGAIEYIHHQLIDYRDHGNAVLLVSLELDEIMNLSDRILVMYNGEIVHEADPKKITYHDLGLYMTGGKRGDVSCPTDRMT
jgi:simple sugar transport system ATP-binding protein